MTMSPSHLAAALLLCAASAAAQPGQTAAAVGMSPGAPSMASAKPGAVGSSMERAQEFMLNARTYCQMVEHDNKLWAICDNSVPQAKIRGSTGYLPQTVEEWRVFTAALQNADQVINRHGRAVVVMNGDKVIAEANAAGFVTLKN
jgi:hypothetical protein